MPWQHAHMKSHTPPPARSTSGYQFSESIHAQQGINVPPAAIRGALIQSSETAFSENQGAIGMNIYIYMCSLALITAGCASHQGPHGTNSTPTTGVVVGCAASDVRMVTLEAKTPDEPTLAVLTPTGWEHSSALNSPTIRGAIANVGLRANGFTPNAVAPLEDLTGKVTSAQKGIDAERSTVSSKPASPSNQEPTAPTADTRAAPSPTHCRTTR